MNSAATFFNASRRFGFKSFASILAETSIAITISIPLVVFVFEETFTVCGRARAKTTRVMAINRRLNRKCLTVVQTDLFWRPFVLEIFSCAVCFLFFKTYQYTNNGTSTSSHKNSVWVKLTCLNIIFVLLLV